MNRRFGTTGTLCDTVGQATKSRNHEKDPGFSCFRGNSNSGSIQLRGEGLAVCDPGALTPSCDSVKLMVYSEKDPQKADSRIVDARIVDQIWQDFAAYR